MSSIIPKDLVGDEKEVERYVQYVQSAGRDIIELRYVTNGTEDAPVRVYGFEVAVMGDLDDDSGIKCVVASVTFNAAKNVPGVWAYIIDTPVNRNILIHSFSNGSIKIINKTLESELKLRAKELGVSTEKEEEGFQHHVRSTPKEKKALEEVDRMKKEKDEMDLKYKKLLEEVETIKKKQDDNTKVDKEKPTMTVRK